MGSRGTTGAELVVVGTGSAGWAVAWTDDGGAVGDGDVAGGGALGVAVSGAAVAVPVDVVPVGAGDG
ncbi:hypothetical protein ACFVWT_04075 [Arthrobacter sp. NPDC058288]|uniref:hypothetical protein n=1 Tax=Arthrobacter sp. NPDC058288 TaxID=3346424 RepID=UPI0036EF7F50